MTFLVCGIWNEVIQINLFTKQKQTHRCREKTCWLEGKNVGKEIVRDFGISMYTLLYLKWITNKDLLYSTWNSAPCYVAALMGAGFEWEWIRAITSWQIDGETMKSDCIFLGSKITEDGDCSHEIKKRLLLGRKAMTNLESMLKSRDITLTTKANVVKAMVFPVVMYGYELDYKESWVPKNWCFWTVVLEKTLESLGLQEIQPVYPKGD